MQPKPPCLRAAALGSCLLAASLAWAMPDIQVNGLLPNQVVVTIDGQQRILKPGKPSPEGVTLISSDSKKAVMEWEGERIERSISKQISSQFSAPEEKKEARIPRGQDGHFFTAGHINSQLVNFMVDTGAFAIAMSSDEADRLGLDWRTGTRFMSGTAGGATASHEVTLKTVTVGGITINNVKAAVIVTEPMPYILLGMSFLERTEMREENNLLVLRKKY